MDDSSLDKALSIWSQIRKTPSGVDFHYLLSLDFMDKSYIVKAILMTRRPPAGSMCDSETQHASYNAQTSRIPTIMITNR